MDGKATRTFRINTCPYGDADIYLSNEVKIESGVTLFLGCNGAGKTTLMRQLEAELKNHADTVASYWYDGASADRKLSFKASMGTGTMDYLLSKFLSEGENLQYRLETMIIDLGSFVKEAEDNGKEEAWIFFDSLDSGWSIDKMSDFAEFLNGTVLADKSEDLRIFVIVAANSYEFVRIPEWNRLDVQTMAYLPEFGSYEDYRNYVFRSRIRKFDIWSGKKRRGNR